MAIKLLHQLSHSRSIDNTNSPVQSGRESVDCSEIHKVCFLCKTDMLYLDIFMFYIYLHDSSNPGVLHKDFIRSSSLILQFANKLDSNRFAARYLFLQNHSSFHHF